MNNEVKGEKCLTSSLLLSEPERPADVVIEPDRDATSGLRVRWSHPRGRVDWYELSLVETGSADRRATRVMGTAAPQSGFTALTPGSFYTLRLQARAGARLSEPVISTAVTGTRTSNLY